MTTSMGKTLRLGRLLDPDTNTSIVLPMDHGVEEAGYSELESPIELIGGLAQAGVNAFLTRRGLAAYADGGVRRPRWMGAATDRAHRTVSRT